MTMILQTTVSITVYCLPLLQFEKKIIRMRIKETQYFFPIQTLVVTHTLNELLLPSLT